jgi:co-chaperonin GroES (HSP10)
MDLIPPHDRVICQLLPAETHTAFGLELPEQARQAPLRAVVLAVGDGIPDPKSPDFPIALGAHYREGNLDAIIPGDEVILPPVGGSEITTDDGETVISILAESILAVVG